jgi:hypothetical protein
MDKKSAIELTKSFIFDKNMQLTNRYWTDLYESKIALEEFVKWIYKAGLTIKVSQSNPQ